MVVRLAAFVLPSLSLGIFLVDLAAPLGKAVWAAYLLPLLLTLWLPQRWAPLLAGAGCSVLILLGALAARGGVSQDVVVFNRLMGETVLWLAVLLILLYRRTAEAQRSSEGRLQGVLAAAPDPIVVIQEDGTVLAWNRAAERTFGWRADEMVGRSVERIVPERFREAHRRGVARGLAAGETRVIRREDGLTALRKDGREIPVLCSLAAWAAAGRTLYCGVLRDASDLQRQQRALVMDLAVAHVLNESGSLEQAAGAFLAAVGEGLGADLGLLWLGGEGEGDRWRCAGRWVRPTLDGALADALSVPGRGTFVEGLPGRVRRTSELQWATALTVDAPGPRTDAALRAGLRAAWGFPVRAGGGTIGVVELFAREGTPPTAELRQKCLVLGAQLGQFIERQRAERALSRTYEQLVEAQRIAHLGSWDWEVTTNRLAWSDEVYRIFGLAPREFGASYEAFLGRVHPDDRPAVEAAVRAALAEGRPYSIEHRLVRPDGTERRVHERAEVLRDAAGRPVRMVGTVLDITERKEAEEALQRTNAQLCQAQKMEAIGRLAGGVAHDFNNLLTVISGYAQLALGDPALPAPLAEGIEQIHRASARAASLTRQLLVFSRQERAEPRPLDLNQAVLNLEKMLRRILGEDVRLEIDLTPGLGPVLADEMQVDQVIMNLAVNARDAMPAGGTLTIRTAEAVPEEALDPRAVLVPAPGPAVMLAVRDTGCGIPSDVLPRIFEPFFTTKESGKGTGLGLSTVYGILRQHGGGLAVESRVGEGTIFRVYLPRAEGDEAASQEPVEQPAPPVSGGTVLVVEDDEPVRTLVRRTLAIEGFLVFEAADGLEALRSCEERRGGIRLLVADLVLPGMGGRELAGRVRALNPSVRVLYISGYPDQQPSPQELAWDDAAFLAKPFSPSDLVATVRALLASPPAAG